MSVSNIPGQIKNRLWGKAGGRCQYEGCNTPLWYDDITKCELNRSYIAHIIADKPGGPRGHTVLSYQLNNDISNLMLLCDEHHRFVDKVAVNEHSVERLRTMKQDHEQRVEIATGITAEKHSHIFLYGANIGEHNSPVSYEKAARALFPEWYPTDKKSNFFRNEKQFLPR